MDRDSELGITDLHFVMRFRTMFLFDVLYATAQCLYIGSHEKRKYVVIR